MSGVSAEGLEGPGTCPPNPTETDLARSSMISVRAIRATPGHHTRVLPSRPKRYAHHLPT